MRKNNIMATVLLVMGLFIANVSFGQRIFKVTTAGEANVKVFITTDASQADIKVKVVPQAADANKDGLWFLAATAPEAMLKVYETTNAAEADVKVYYVTDEMEAGWVTTNKRQFFKGNK